MVAAAETACRELEGAKLPELNGLELFDEILPSRLGTEPNSRRGCFRAVGEAVRSAFKGHRDRLVEEFTGEKALICTCFGVSEETIMRFIESARPSRVDEVSAACRAGSGCGACRMLIQELIDLVLEQRDGK